MMDVISTREKSRLTAKLKRLRERNVALDIDLMNRVSAIVDEVRVRGDAALIDYALEFDHYSMQRDGIRICETELRRSAALVDPDLLAALRESIKRVRAFHEHQVEKSWVRDGASGVTLGERVTPIERVGVYVPGGTAAYPSSLVMNVVPAQIAGVEEIVAVTPPRTVHENPAIAAALVELGVTQAYAVGGAQAIASMAYGTETVTRVHKIVGPGNRYVTAAKKLVFGVVGIDSLAGPSEVLIVADETAHAGLVAADLLAQAEHSEDAAALLITTSQDLAPAVLAEVAAQTNQLPRARTIESSLSDYGVIIVAESIDEACELVNEIAPEHLEIMVRDADAIAARIKHGGAIFIGQDTPEAVGDYLAGPNHVLPTSGAAKFSSALSVRDFIKRTSLVKFSAVERARVSASIAVLARAEGLEGHARSVLMRGQLDGK